MGMCMKCPACFRPNCNKCPFCLKNAEGKRVHRKCRERICHQDRIDLKPQIASEASLDYAAVKLIDDLKAYERSQRKIKKAMPCDDPKQIAKELSRSLMQ